MAHLELIRTHPFAFLLQRELRSFSLQTDLQGEIGDADDVVVGGELRGGRTGGYGEDWFYGETWTETDV